MFRVIYWIGSSRTMGNGTLKRTLQTFSEDAAVVKADELEAQGYLARVVRADFIAVNWMVMN